MSLISCSCTQIYFIYIIHMSILMAKVFASVGVGVLASS